MLNEDEVEFTTKYLLWIHAVERTMGRRLTEYEVSRLIMAGVSGGILKQQELQDSIIAATDEFLLSLRVDEDEPIL